MADDFWGELQERDMESVLRRLKPEAKSKRAPMLLYEMRMRKKRAEREEKQRHRQKESEYTRRISGVAYGDVISERLENKRTTARRLRRERVQKERMYVAKMASNTVMKKDTNYPRFLERSTPEKMGDAYSGPTDPAEWGPRGHTFYWNRYRADVEALPMSLLVEGPL